MPETPVAGMKQETSPPGGPQPPAKLFKNMLHGSGLYSIAIVGQRVVGVALLPITTRFLAPSDYGVLDLLEQVGSVLSVLLGLAFSSALGYFYFQTPAGPERRRVVSTTVIGSAVVGLLAGAICWPFAGMLSRLVFGTEAVKYSLYLVFATMAPIFLLEALLGWLRVENRPGMWVLGSLMRLGVTVAGVVLFVAVFRLRVVGVQYAAFAAAAIPAVILGAYCLIKTPPSFDLKVFVRMTRFAIPLGLSGIAMFIIHFGDRFVLQRYVSFTDLGLYALAYKIGMLVSALYASFHSYWSAQVYQVMRRDDATEIFGRVFTYMAVVIAFCGWGVVACSKPALKLLAAPAYQSAAQLVPLLVAAYCIRAVGDFFRCLFLVEGRPGADAIATWIASVVCLGGYFALIPPFGAWGAAAATAVTFLVFTVISMVWVYKVRPYRVEGARLAKVGVALAAVAIPYAALPVTSLPAQIAWAALLVAAFPALLWLMRFPSMGERAAVAAVLQTTAHRLGLRPGAYQG